MKYIKVTNITKNVNRLRLEKLGFSSKRDDEETIGQFGSGIKFAPIAAIRKGIDFVFAGNDSKGSYTLRYITKQEDDIESIFYKYDDYEKPSSFTADAGLLSWESDFQIYREIIANAIDESKITGENWSIEIVDVDEIAPVQGEFSVYFTATESMIEICKNHDKYFLNNRTPVFQGETFSLYQAIDDNMRVYCKGVLVFSSDTDLSGDSMMGLFDYEFKNIKLNEERKVSSPWEMNFEIMKALSYLSDEKLIQNTLEDLINNLYENKFYETNAVQSGILSHNFYGSSREWNDSFNSLYVDSVIAKSSECSINLRKTIESRGYEVVTIDDDNLYSFLINRGVPTYFSVLGEGFKYEFNKNLEKYPALIKAIEVVETVDENIMIKDIVGVYEDQDKDTLGLTVSLTNESGDKYKIILINEYHADNSNIQGLISTLIHEWDHYTSGVSDGDLEGRMFRDLADQRVARIFYKMYKMIKSEVNV